MGDIYHYKDLQTFSVHAHATSISLRLLYPSWVLKSGNRANIHWSSHRMPGTQLRLCHACPPSPRVRAQALIKPLPKPSWGSERSETGTQVCLLSLNLRALLIALFCKMSPRPAVAAAGEWSMNKNTMRWVNSSGFCFVENVLALETPSVNICSKLYHFINKIIHVLL